MMTQYLLIPSGEGGVEQLRCGKGQRRAGETRLHLFVIL